MTAVNITGHVAACHKRKSESRFSPEVRTIRSTGGSPGAVVSRQRSSSSALMSEGRSRPSAHALPSRRIDAAISLRDVYEKHTVSVCRVLPCVMRITRCISPYSEALTRDRSPTTRTRTPCRCTRCVSSLISRSPSSASAISASTSDWERLKFSIEKAYTVTPCTPSSQHQRSTCSSLSYPIL